MYVKSLVFSFLFLLLAPAASADDIFADAQERETWRWLLKRADRTEHVERDRKGKLKWVGFYIAEKEKGDYYSGSLTLEAGRVVKMVFNNANFTNDDFKRIAAFKRLKTLTAWHNGWDKQKDGDKSVYSGAGLVHFKSTPIESVNFGGSWFNDEGVAAATKVPSLKQLIIYHTRVTDEGLKALAGDTHIELLRLGPQYSMKVSGKALEPISRMKALKHLELNETWLSWEGELEHLTRLKGQLETFTCKVGLIAEGDLKKLKAALPDTKIEYTRAEEKFVEKMKRVRARGLRE